MYTRVTNNLTNQQIISSIMTNRNDLLNLQNLATSGNKVEKASDDPIAASDIMSSNEKLNKMSIYIENIDFLNAEANVLDDNYASITEDLTRALELAERGANAVSGAADMSDIAQEVKQLIQSIKDSANTQYDGKYLFSGTNTTTPAYTIDDKGQIIYNGSVSDYKNEYEIGENSTISINENGGDIFGYSKIINEGPPAEYEDVGIFGTLAKLDRALTAEVKDKNEIRACLDGINEGIDKILNKRTEIGSIQSRMETLKDQYSLDEITYETIKSNAQEIDMVQVLSDLTNKEYALQASLQINSSTMSMSLLNYM